MSCFKEFVAIILTDKRVICYLVFIFFFVVSMSCSKEFVAIILTDKRVICYLVFIFFFVIFKRCLVSSEFL